MDNENISMLDKITELLENDDTAFLFFNLGIEVLKHLADRMDDETLLSMFPDYFSIEYIRNKINEMYLKLCPDLAKKSIVLLLNKSKLPN